MSEWELQYEACNQAHRDLMEKIAQRSRRARSSQLHQELTSDIVAGLAQFSTRAQRLQSAITQRRGPEAMITSGEISRRHTLVDELITKERQMRDILDRVPSGGVRDQRSDLLSGFGVSDRGNVDWSALDIEPQSEAPPESSQPSAGQLKLHQDQELAVQDRGLDTLHEIIVRQKHMAQHIGHEVEAQNELLEDIDQGMDQTHQRLLATTHQITRVEQRDHTCRYWIVILVLLVPIVILALWPHR